MLNIVNYEIISQFLLAISNKLCIFVKNLRYDYKFYSQELSVI